MTAFNPGQSPPPVNKATFIVESPYKYSSSFLVLSLRLNDLWCFDRKKQCIAALLKGLVTENTGTEGPRGGRRRYDKLCRKPALDSCSHSWAWLSSYCWCYCS